MSKRRRRPQQWTIDDVLIPMAGDVWACPDQYTSGAFSGNWRERTPGESLLDRLHGISGVVYTMAGDAQRDCLPELKKIRATLQKLTKEFSEAVDYAEEKSRPTFTEILEQALGRPRNT
jgi:hypothetical protein